MEIQTLILGPLLTNCYILISEKEAVVVDPGGEVQEILEKIKGKKLLAIILTHYHWDHTLGVKALREKTGAPVLVHENEKNYFKLKADRYLKGGEEIKIGKEKIKIIHTPGHSPGSICLLGKDFILTGDTIFADGIGRTDLPGGSEKDMKKTLELLKEIIFPGMKVYPGHGVSFEK